MKNKDKTIMGAVKESLTKSDRYFSKPTVDNAQPTKVVTTADIDARIARNAQTKNTNEESSYPFIPQFSIDVGYLKCNNIIAYKECARDKPADRTATCQPVRC